MSRLPGRSASVLKSRTLPKVSAPCTEQYPGHIITPVAWLYGISGFFVFLGGVAYVLLKFSGSIRNLVGLEKDRLDIKKARREDEQAGSLIQSATLDDVKEYDPKFKAIQRRKSPRENAVQSAWSPFRRDIHFGVHCCLRYPDPGFRLDRILKRLPPSRS
jgi:hypothetical protein